MPAVSEKQRRAMFAAASGHSSLGIPASVGKEFIGKDDAPRAAGVLMLAKDGRALFVKRAQGDHAGSWAFPGGLAIGGETPSEAAIREFEEETGNIPLIADSIHRSTDPIEFVTHLARAEDAFVPALNEEHNAFAWAPLDDPPQPLHPGVAAMLADAKARDEAFEEAYDARLKCGTDEAMAMDYAARVAALISVRTSKHRTGIAFDRESVRKMDRDGRLHVVKANISKAAVNPYLGREIPEFEKLGLDPDKIYQLLRHPDELKRAVESFNNLPLLDSHVAVSAEDHAPDSVIGSLGTDANYEHPFLTNSLVVWAKHGIDGIESAEQRELSSSYRYDADMSPGEYEGEHFDGVMRSIVGNHVALVEKGRAGSDVVVGDSAIQTEITIMKKLSRAGVLLHGAIRTAILPKLAKDAAVDLSPVLAKITAKNFKSEKANIFTALKKACSGKLAKDADLEDVTQLLDALEKAGVDELDPNAAPMPGMAGEENDNPDDAMDAGAGARIAEYLKGCLGRALTEEDIAKVAEMASAPAEDEFPPKKDEDKKDDDDKKDEPAKDAPDPEEKKDMVDKKAMDAALVKTAQDTEAKVMARMQAIADAKEAVEPYVGKIKVAMDSAEKVYVTALNALGVDGLEDMPLKALQKILAAQPKPGHGQRETTTIIAQDAASAKGFLERFPQAGRISVAR